MSHHPAGPGPTGRTGGRDGGLTLPSVSEKTNGKFKLHNIFDPFDPLSLDVFIANDM